MGNSSNLNLFKFKAFLFDLDGVLTSTETIHASCWKEMFDTFLSRYYSNLNKPKELFDLDKDYTRYVDGKPRINGVKDFLLSRNIKLPMGDKNSPIDEDSICGLGNNKNALVLQKLKSVKLRPYKGVLNTLRFLDENNFKIAVVTSSRNGKLVLDSLNIVDMFDTVVDGNVAEELNLQGKPKPDTYLKAAEILGVNPIDSVVIEDSISGVRAGKNGNFGLVIGVAKRDNSKELLENGADIIISEIDELIN